MKDIAEAIKERRSAILRLQAEMEVLERARALLNGGATEIPMSVSVVPGTTRINIMGAEVRVRRGPKVHPMKGKVNPKSSVGLTVAVLRESGVPLHIGEILIRVKKRGGEAKKASLVSTLMRMSKRSHIFYKADQPSTFGLVEWQKAKATATA